MRNFLFSIIIFLLINEKNYSQIKVFFHQSLHSTSILNSQQTTFIYTDSTDDWLIQQSAMFLQIDIEKVTTKKPVIVHDLNFVRGNLIVVSTISKINSLKSLSKLNKVNYHSLQDQWEAFQIATVQDVSKNIPNALVITGSDKRGTAFGVFEFTKQIGVSPWYWWADVPISTHKEIYIQNGVYFYSSPTVKYRGIFINDEAPAFSSWTKEKFNGVNHLVYEKVFELLLRLKANYLWPAMWGNAFNDDDPLNPILADKYGIVMGTSHHEPMLRAQQEWKRYGSGAWNYNTNDSTLRSFWKKGIENMGHHESIITIGMRGDGDEPMMQGTAISLLEKIVNDQRSIIEKVTHRPPNQQPQLWALYKEVQDYYDKGMRVPDDVTLLLCDDNWGNLRKLPSLSSPKRQGGYGVYYHFDYVGGPRNYKWINTNNISRVWEQMHLAYEHGVDKIWIVNVGDIKPMEFPISFFLDFAWNTKIWNQSNLNQYYISWAKEQFGIENAKSIAVLLQKYSQLSARKKPELLNADTYNITNYNEADRVLAEFEELMKDAEDVQLKLPLQYHDAYFQLVLHPIKALTNLTNLYITTAKNKWAAKYFQSNTNMLAEKAKILYLKDSIITNEYNHLNHSKWNHMMDQTHIGYTYWQQPLVNKMPEVKYINENQIQPNLSNQTKKDISALKYITTNTKQNQFFELNGYVSIYAKNYSKCVVNENIEWDIIPNIGKITAGLTTFPVTATASVITKLSPHVEYDIFVYDTGNVKINTFFSPTLNYENLDGLKCAISIDDETPKIININQDLNNNNIWNQAVANNIITKATNHFIHSTGKHKIKFWRIDPGVILQQLIVDFGGLKESYLGPPETIL